MNETDLTKIEPKKIVLINCFFGNPSWYFALHLKTCSKNKDVSFIVFTDNSSFNNYNIPENVSIILITGKELRQRIKNVANIELEEIYPYKICDYRPMFGDMFKDYLTNYAFWGYYDLDVLFGNITRFITPDLLENYDIISVREERLTGYFLLFKNNSYINSLYKKSKDLHRVVTELKSFCFDECANLNYKLSKPEDILDLNDIDIESIQHVVEKEKRKGKIKVLYQLMAADGTPGKMVWDDGTLYYRSKIGDVELMLYHLISYKKMPFSLKNFKGIELHQKFHIDRYCIYTNKFSLKRLFYGHLNKKISIALNLLDFCLSRFFNFKKKEGHFKGDYVYGTNRVLNVKHDKGNYLLSYSNSVLDNDSKNEILTFNMFFRKNAVGYLLEEKDYRIIRFNKKQALILYLNTQHDELTFDTITKQ